MADHEATTIQTIGQRYAPALISFAVLVFGAVQTAAATGPFNLVVILQLVALAVGTGSTYFLPLVDTKWQGAFKTGVELVTTAVALVLPFAIVGHITGPQILLVIVGLIKAIGAQLGVAIRVDPQVAPAAADGAFDVSTLPVAEVETEDHAVQASSSVAELVAAASKDEDGSL
ncbi:hypothetical protein [Frondihabitans sp. VKM Ac-2883]|uniref:hypothetical protein n=1 Tax=Frondihabitans sp. VKM Ac-2883 TaxID=2783823 RepID=UPI00188BCC08|nr:hypothetical protein [Frondihabitans sp. VKM Ac-2883]MBF4574664.1 hypothetical protein [Frondihabitans sp. VKM Ac-2883]